MLGAVGLKLGREQQEARGLSLSDRRRHVPLRPALELGVGVGVGGQGE